MAKLRAKTLSPKLFLWKKTFLEGKEGINSLSEKKRIPKTKRKRLWDSAILEEIQSLRNEHPNFGKDKIHPLPTRFCKEKKLNRPTSSAIGRIIKDMGGLRLFPQKVSHFEKMKPLKRRKVLRKPKDLKVMCPEHSVSLEEGISLQ